MVKKEKFEKTSTSTREYFNSPAVNQSRLKLLLGNNPDAYNSVETPEMYFVEKDHFVIGDAIDCRLTCPEEYEERFYESKLVSKPSDTMKSMIHLIFDTHKMSLTPDEKPIISMQDLPSELIVFALDEHGYQKYWKEQTRINKVLESQDYWEEIIYSIGKTILSQEDVDVITNTEMSLRSNPLCAHLFQTPPAHIKVFYQFPIFFDVSGHSCKGLLDIVVVNYKDKTIQIIDVKTLSRDTLYFPSQFKKFRYDIQGAFYYVGMNIFKQGFKDVEDFTVLNPVFLVESTVKPGNPLMFSMSDVLIDQACHGSYPFHFNDDEKAPIIRHEITGFLSLLHDLTFYTEHGFSKKKEIVVNNGKFTINHSYIAE